MFWAVLEHLQSVIPIPTIFAQSGETMLALDGIEPAPRDCQLGGVDPVGNAVHWHVNGIQFGGNERLYPGAATLEAFDRNVVRDITFAGVAALFDCLDIVGEEPSILLDEVVHEEPIVADLERKDRHVGTMAEIPSGVNRAVDDLEIGNDASLAIGVAHQGSAIAPDDG